MFEFFKQKEVPGHTRESFREAEKGIKEAREDTIRALHMPETGDWRERANAREKTARKKLQELMDAGHAQAAEMNDEYERRREVIAAAERELERARQELEEFEIAKLGIVSSDPESPHN